MYIINIYFIFITKKKLYNSRIINSIIWGHDYDMR